MQTNEAKLKAQIERFLSLNHKFVCQIFPDLQPLNYFRSNVQKASVSLWYFCPSVLNITYGIRAILWWRISTDPMADKGIRSSGMSGQHQDHIQEIGLNFNEVSGFHSAPGPLVNNGDNPLNNKAGDAREEKRTKGRERARSLRSDQPPTETTSVQYSAMKRPANASKPESEIWCLISTIIAVYRRLGLGFCLDDNNVVAKNEGFPAPLLPEEENKPSTRC